MDRQIISEINKSKIIPMPFPPSPEPEMPVIIDSESVVGPIEQKMRKTGVR